MYQTESQLKFGLVLGETLLLENKIPKDPEIAKMVRDLKVKKLISLSKKYFKNPNNVSEKDKNELEELFQDEKIKRYLVATTKVGRRMGWLSGGFFGGSFGATGGAIIGLGTGSLLGWFALVLFGALIGGLSVGFITSRIMGDLRRWDAENQMTSGQALRVHY